ncbi:uncharacterized protein LOC119614571 isoform X1 [Lucilia sericata]|uniref:uncharacterized protein LOC119614571 isoform X1 n=1 Tax=Lucilia sericata TaxID=13632 RepID=UPI0018A84862|nr:uncharacterized protein LOC119614571 isoform X1 [Lucilia sericata]
MMPLMYVILKDAGVDIDEASKRIEEGIQVLKQYNLNIYDGNELRKLKTERRYENHLARSECDETIKQIRLKEGKHYYTLIYNKFKYVFYSKIRVLQKTLKTFNLGLNLLKHLILPNNNKFSVFI